MHRRIPGRRVLAGAFTVLALALTALGAAVTAHPAAAVVGDCTPGSDWGTSRPDLASSVVSLINAHRTSMGLVSLNVSPTLTNAAVWKARHMAKYSYMAHDDPAPPVARTPADRLEACGYPSRTSGWGENIAYGYSTPSSVVDAWLNSPGHRANIENSSYRSTGVGAASDASGVLYWSQEFGTYDDSGSAGGGGGGVSAPTVSLTSGPSSTTTATSASFGWSTTGTVSSTTCSLDGAAAVACTSPTSYTGLATGSHSFRVTVSNSAGSASASYTWSVTATPPPTTGAPTVSLTSGPPSSTTATSASFGWSTTGTVSSTTCSLDGAAAVACASPKSYTGLATGSHSFRVTVSNSTGSASASYTWTVATTVPPPTSAAPLISLTSGPARLTSSHSASFAWATSGAVTSTRCSLDYGTAVACSSPWQASNLQRGSHRFTVTVSGPGGSATAVTTWYIYA